MGIFSKVLTAGEGKQLKQFQAIVPVINDLEPKMQQLSDAELRALTQDFRARLDNGAELEDILPEAFAATREASVRTTGLRHFDVQLIGGMVLNEGEIAEMKTGEGKTLVSTLAGYLNALTGKGVHIVTVNDYLARRDSEWMGEIYRFLGMNVGLIQSGMKPSQKIAPYKADVTYGTNSEFGFDYLRDNMVTRAANRVQRGHAYAIVDEVDSILIDEARTPLIISGAGTKSSEIYARFARYVPLLKPEIDFDMEESKNQIACTEQGLKKIETLTGYEDIYSDMSGQLVNHLQQALRAQFLFHRDVDYVVVNGEVKIVDEFTGRIMEGRRYSEGLHQALEAKEHVMVREENQTLATITLQNYFRLYDKLAGMTGTAMTEDAEFKEIYKLGVQAIPPNKPVIRVDENDLVYKDIDCKFNAVANDIQARHENGQPCLIGTVSIESSERLSRLLNKRGIQHEILNAKNHEREASIVAQAGRKGAVTIATNMAGRGTDILLGGNPLFLAEDILTRRGLDEESITEEDRVSALNEAKEICAKEHDEVVNAGGLAVIGTERHESRRIDNQLRGRSGRQGDPGCTRFYLSLEDELMRLFGGDKMGKIQTLMEKTSVPDDMPIQANMVNKAIEGAQRNVEQRNFSIRKHVLEYDDVMNKQRSVIYDERNLILDGKDIHGKVEEIMDDTVKKGVESYCPENTTEDEWDWDGLNSWFAELTGIKDIDLSDEAYDDDPDKLSERVMNKVLDIYIEKDELLGTEVLRSLEAQVMLRVIDTRWMNHLQDMDYLKEGIGLRGMGGRDPLTEYKSEAFEMFGYLVDSMYEDYLRTILRMHINAVPEESELVDINKAKFSGPASLDGSNSFSSTGAGSSPSAVSATAVASKAPTKITTYEKDKDDPFANVGRNDPCPCGSGLKYKKCHGAPKNN